MEQNEKKKKSEKKIKVQETWLGYCPFTVCVGSRYNKLYHDTGCAAGAHGQAGHNHDTVGHDHDTAQLGCDIASTRAQHSPARVIGFCIVTQILCRDRGAAHACLGSAPVVSRYSFCIVTGGRPGCWVYQETGYDTARSSVRYDWKGNDTAGPYVRHGAATRRANARVHTSARPGTCMTWPGRGP